MNLRRIAAIGVVPALTFGLARSALAFNVVQVTGQNNDPTQAGNQAETFCAASSFGGNVIESVAYNDDTGETPTFVQYTLPSGRVVFPGFSGFGWSSRVVGSSGPGPWSHTLFETPLSLGWDAVWGDPSIASNDALPGVVFAGTLAIPHQKFVDFSNFKGTPGTIQGPVGNTISPLGGGCVYRSVDGGQSFAIVDCVRDTTDAGTLFDTDGHFYDGSSMAIAKDPGGGSGFFAYIAFIDSNYNRQAVWTMTDATSNAAHPFQPDSTVVGNIGPLPGEEVGAIETHVRLAASGSQLFEMSALDNGAFVNAFNGNVGFFPADLKVNLREANHNAIALADNAQIGLGVVLGNDAMGNPLTFRTGPQFALDVGLNESGDPEMRFVYVAMDLDTNRNLTASYLQAGFCTTDLATCVRPKQWRTTMSTLGPEDYFPAIKFGVAPGSGAPSWKITWQRLSGQKLAIFSADLQRPDLVPASATFTPTALKEFQESPFQTPCPDRRADSNGGNAGYWGDYDGMTYDAAHGRFLRTFTDSSQGCDLRGLLTSHNVHVSEVDPVALGAPREALVTLSDIGFFTTGGNVFNCGGPAGGPNHQSICCEDSNGDFSIACKPVVNPDGSYSTAEQHVSQNLSCGDGHGAWLDVFCEGTGLPGDTTITGRVEMSVSSDCNKDDMPNDTGNDQVTSFTVVGDQQQDLGLGLACDTFSNICASSPCVFNAFSAGDVVVTNTGQ